MAPRTIPRMAPSADPAYKLLLAQPRMVEDVLCGFIAPRWCDHLDFSTLSQMNPELIGADLHRRIGDMAWRVELEPASPLGEPPLANGQRPYLLILFEHQSTVDPDMAFRMHEYVYLLHRHLRNNGTVKAQGRAPPILPVIVYNGIRPWTAPGARPGPVAAPGTAGWIGDEAWAYALLDERERADEGADLMGSRLPPDNRMTMLIGLETSPVEARPRLLAEAFERYPGEEERGLREGYHARVRSPGGRYGSEALPSFEEMERVLAASRGGREMETLMEARTREFEERAIARGIVEGREQGIAQGREQAFEEMERVLAGSREERETETLMEARTREFEERAIARGIVQGRKQVFEEMVRVLAGSRGEGETETLVEARAREFEERAIAQGREQGIAQVRAEERALLCRLAERRFGAETAARLAEPLAGVEDAEDLVEAGDWIVDCRTGDELLERLRHARGT